MKKNYIFLVYIFFNISLFAQEEEKQKTINIGTSLVLSGFGKQYGQYVKEGLDLGIKYVNDRKLLKNKILKLTSYDDEFSPEKALDNMKKLLDKNINIILTPIGSSILKGYIDLIKEGKILVLFPDVTSPEYRLKEKDNKYYIDKNIIHFLASSDAEGKALAEYIVKNFENKKIAVITPIEDNFCFGAFKEAKKIFDEKKLKEGDNWKCFDIKTKNLSIKALTDDVKKFIPEVIFFIGFETPTIEFIKSIGVDYLAPKILVGFSTYATASFKEYLKNSGLKMIKTALMPDPGKSDLRLVEVYKEFAKENNIELNAVSLEGFFSVLLFTEICQNISGDINKDNVLEKIESGFFKNYDFMGLKLNWDQNRRELFKSLWLCNLDDKWEKIDY